MKEKTILKIATGISVLLIPTLFRKPSVKYWSSLFLLSGVINHSINRYLTKKRYITYPKRFAPKVFKIELVYDYLICPYISIWFCQATYKANVKKIFGTSFLFALPQMLLELWALKKTKLIRYHNHWTLLHTFVAILSVKLLSRGILGISKKMPFINKTFLNNENQIK
ncbi:CBO0543 family protein [Paenibacillus cremeus]|uniref:Uncharacterized protein n=1 Tax=Paenibacillus cremeus TaxID=2163881 RepID=A0A559KAD2_9BACL|nr:CBO0543 family protein [Paenibacillus cremeus]TVY09084.1 hypothetical protein FPZ49_15345 [Paenibacillus cremeus]